MIIASILDTFGGAVEFIFERRPSDAGTVDVGGLAEIGHLAGNHFAVSFLAIVISIAISIPIGLWLGHLGKAELLAVGVANVGRAVPALAIIGFCVAFLGTGFNNIAFALTLLAIPPILTNTYVGMRQVDPELVDAARGQGLVGLSGRTPGRVAARAADDLRRHPHLRRDRARDGDHRARSRASTRSARRSSRRRSMATRACSPRRSPWPS